jgi:molybdate transport system substrate-binding protein
MFNELRIMTSGAFTAAHLELIPAVEKLSGKKVVTVTTSVGTGETSIASRLQRGEVADVVIVADDLLRQFVADKLVLDAGHKKIASSMIGIAVRAGAPKPDVSTAEAFKRFMLAARYVAYSASVSGKYLTTEIYPRLGIADVMMPKSHLTTGGVRTGAVVARGDADVCCQQISEMLPVEGIAHITPLPPELQKVSFFSAGVGVNSADKVVAQQLIDFLASPAAAAAIRKSGLEPA